MGEWNQITNHNEKSLIDLLIRLNLVTQAQVTNALEIQCRQSQAQRQSLETLLLDMEVISDINLLQAKQLLNFDNTTQSKNRVDELKDWHSKASNVSAIEPTRDSFDPTTSEPKSAQDDLSLDGLARSMDKLGFNSPAKSQPGSNMPDLESTLDRLGFTNKKTDTSSNKAFGDLASSLDQLGFDASSSSDAAKGSDTNDLQALFAPEPTRSQASHVAPDLESALDMLGFSASHNDSQQNQTLNQLESLFNSPAPDLSQYSDPPAQPAQSDFESALQLLGFEPEPVSITPPDITVQTQEDHDFESALEMLGLVDSTQAKSSSLPAISDLDHALDLVHSIPSAPPIVQQVTLPESPPAPVTPPPQAASPPFVAPAVVPVAEVAPASPPQGMRAAGAFASRNVAQQGGGSWAAASPQKIITSQIPPQAAQAIRSIDKPLPRSPLGEILIKNNELQEWQLTHALCIQRDAPTTTPKLGTLLVQLGYAEAKAVEKALNSQK